MLSQRIEALQSALVFALWLARRHGWHAYAVGLLVGLLVGFLLAAAR